MSVRAFFLGLREVFLLEAAERDARDIDDAERERRRRLVRAARSRRAVARKTSSPAAAITLLRESLALALRATHPQLGFELADVLAATPLATYASGARARVLEHLADASPLASDDLDFARAESLRDALEDCLAAALGEAKTRSVLGVRALRYGRFVAVALLVAWLVASYARTHWMVHDVALGAVVTSSPLRAESPTAEHVVDGDRRGTFGLATIETTHPFVSVDLRTTCAVQHVDVYNRGDGWFDDSLPLVMSVSVDGVTFEDVARRTDHFTVWRVDLGGRHVRIVRIQMPKRGYIALNEIEVYGRILR